MVFKSGKDVQVVIDEYNLTSFFRQVEIANEIEALDTTVFGKSVHTSIVGLKNGTMSFEGFYDKTATTGSDDILQSALAQASDPLVTVAPTNFTIGNRTWSAQMIETGYTLTSPVDGIVLIAATMQASADVSLERGISLHALAAETSTASGSSVDNLAASTGGLVGFIHCIAVSGTNPTLDVKIQESSDDAVGDAWSDEITFTQLTAVGKERLTTASGTERYLRLTWTIGGTDTPTFTFVVAAARR